MVLTFRSTTPEQRVIVERHSDGSQRVARATQSEGSAQTWNLSLEHPSGTVRHGIFHGDGFTVCVALSQMLCDSEQEFKSEAAAGHRREPSMRPDKNVAVDEDGHTIGNPTIRNYLR